MKINSTVTLLIYYVTFIAVAKGLLSPYFLLLLPILMARWALLTHLNFHKNPQSIDLIAKIQPLVLTPFQLGFMEYRDIHLRHHRYLHSNDPEAYMIEGSSFRAFLGCLASPEIAFFRYDNLKNEGFAFLRLALFILLDGYLGHAWFLIYLLITRFSFASAFFVFHHLFHRDKTTRNLNLRQWLLPLLDLLLTKKGRIDLTKHKDHHHDYQQS